jgi:hypothetical protein
MADMMPAGGREEVLIPDSRLPLRKKRLLLHLIQLVHQGLERRARVVQREGLQTRREHRHEAGVVSRPVIGRGVQRPRVAPRSCQAARESPRRWCTLR